MSSDVIELVAKDAAAMTDEADAMHHALADCLGKLSDRSRGPWTGGISAPAST